MPLDLPTIRSKFPDLKRPVIFLDNSGSTQVAQPVLDQMNAYLVGYNANHSGALTVGKVHSPGQMKHPAGSLAYRVACSKRYRIER
jgi:hypothetical protein